MRLARLGAAAVAAAMVLGACDEQGSGDGGGSTAPPTDGSAGSGRTLRPQSLVGKIDMSGVADALRAFQVSMGRFPTSAEGLKALVSSDGLGRDSDKWQGPYVDSMDAFKDTYGNVLEYENTGNGFVLRSLGADGARGGTGSSADIELRG